MSATSSTTMSAARRTPRYVHVSAWAIPIMVLGQFALLAIVPVGLVLIGAFRDARLRSLRWSTVLLAGIYATPLAIWILRDDRARSLSKDMHPVFIALIVAAAAAVLSKIHTRKE